MRGIAAIFVALFHLGHAGVTQYAPEGYLAVDFFFVLSGVVIAMAYGPRLRDGMSSWDFIERRVIRFFPLYLLGLALGSAKALLLLKFDSTTFLFNLAMLPDPIGERLFPYNSPSWSLFLEMAINVAFALVLFRLGRRALIGVCAFGLGGMLITIGEPHYFNVGWAWDNLPAGMFRTVYAFTLGILLAGTLRQGREGWGFLLPVAALLVVMALPAQGDRLAWEFIAAVVVLPAIVFWGGRTEVPGSVRPLFAFMGDISFALYAIHWPLVGPIVKAGKWLGLSSPAIALLFLGIVIPLSYAAHLADCRVREMIAQRTRRAKAA